MTGYIQADILGKTRGLKFGSLAAENILPELAQLGVITGGNYSSAMLSVVIYWGLYNNCFVKRQEMDFTFEQVCDWVDENWTNEAVHPMIQDIVKAWEDSTSTKKVLDLVKDGDVKKKELTSTDGKDGNTSEGSPSAS